MAKKKTERNILNEYMNATGSRILDEYSAVDEMRNQAHAEGRSFRGVEDLEYRKMFMDDDERYYWDHVDEQVKEISIDVIKPLDFMWEIKDENGKTVETRHVTNPFHIREDDDMQNLRKSIEAHGQLEPIVLRQMDDGSLMCLSGHRRLHVLKSLNQTSVKARVIKCSDIDAIQMMSAYNTRRENPLPSEIGWNYRYQMEAEKAQGKRSDLLELPETTAKNGTSASDRIGEVDGKSGVTVRNYIRLTYLIPELIDLVDSRKLKIKQAVQLSFITSSMQRMVYDCLMESSDYEESLNGEIKGISVWQAGKIRALCEKYETEGNELDPYDISDILMQPKANQEDKITLTEHEWKPFLNKERISDERTRKKYLLSALELRSSIDQELKMIPENERQAVLAHALKRSVDEYLSNNPEFKQPQKAKRRIR